MIEPAVVPGLSIERCLLDVDILCRIVFRFDNNVAPEYQLEDGFYDGNKNAVLQGTLELFDKRMKKIWEDGGWKEHDYWYFFRFINSEINEILTPEVSEK